MKKLFYLIPILLIILFPEQTNAAVTFGEVGVAFADSSGNVLYEVDKNDYNIELNVTGVKYILMYTNSSTIKNNGYNLFYDFAIGYQGMQYPVGINVTQLLENRNGIQFTPSLFNVEGQIQGAQGYYSRYHLNIDFVASSSNAWYQVTLQLPTEMNFTFYSVYNKKFTQTSGNSGSQIESSSQDIIDNQDKNTDKILDDNINDANDSANSFFDNFTDNDNGGISGIVTAPLVAINAMLNGTCSPLTTTFKGKEITLPCGTQLWSKLSGIKDFLNVVLGGLLCYRICIKLFKLIQNMKNPDNDRVEVMDL